MAYWVRLLLVAFVGTLSGTNSGVVNAQTENWSGPLWQFLAGKCYGNEERCGWENLGYVMRLEDEDGECTEFGCAYLPIFEIAWKCGQGDCK